MGSESPHCAEIANEVAIRTMEVDNLTEMSFNVDSQ